MQEGGLRTCHICAPRCLLLCRHAVPTTKQVERRGGGGYKGYEQGPPTWDPQAAQISPSRKAMVYAKDIRRRCFAPNWLQEPTSARPGGASRAPGPALKAETPMADLGPCPHLIHLHSPLHPCQGHTVRLLQPGGDGGPEPAVKAIQSQDSIPGESWGSAWGTLLDPPLFCADRPLPTSLRGPDPAGRAP